MTPPAQTRSAHNPYDKTARFLVRLHPSGFLRWLAQEPDLPYRFSRWLDTRTVPFPGEEDRICDTVAELLDPARPGARPSFVVEFQARAVSRMLYRLLEYVARLMWAFHPAHRTRSPYVWYTGLVNLTGRTSLTQCEFLLPGVAEVGLVFRVIARNLVDEDAGELLAEIAAGRVVRPLLGLVPLMRGGGDPAIPVEWKRVAEPETTPELRAAYRDVARVFSELARRKALWHTALKGWGEMRSVLVDEWKAEGRVEMLLRQGRKRFGGSTPEVERRLAERASEQELDRLGLRLLEVQSWSELLAD